MLGLSVPTLQLSGVTRLGVFCDWLLPPGIMFDRFIHGVLRARAPFLFTTAGYPVVWADHIWFVRSSVLDVCAVSISRLFGCCCAEHS